MAEGFDRAVRRELLRAFPALPLKPISTGSHDLPLVLSSGGSQSGRVQGPAFLEGITYGDRIAVVYSRHDLGGALQRDKLGRMEPGGGAGRGTDSESGRFGSG